MDRRALPFVNNSGETIPPGAALEPDGTVDSEGRIGVRKPTEDNSTRVFFNDRVEVADGEVGQAWSPYPWATAGVNAADLPLPARADVGVESGQWLLTSGKTGFLAVAPDFLGFAQVIPAPATVGAAIIHGTLAAVLNQGSSANLTNSTGGTQLVYDYLLATGDSIASGTKVIAGLDADGKYYVIAAECP